MRKLSRYILFSGTRLYTQSPSKPDMVFLSGLLCDERLWNKVFKIISPFVNPIMVNANKCKTIEEACDLITASSPNTFCLTGFSMGGYIAQEYVLRNPEKVSHLTLAGVRACAYTEDEKKSRYTLIEKAKNALFSGFTEKHFKNWVYENNSQAEIVALVNLMAKDAGINEFIHQQILLLNRPDLRKKLKKISCPTIVIGGSNDIVVTPEKITELADCIPRSQIKFIEKCGHYSPLENPNEFSAQLINFLKNENFFDIKTI